MASVLSFSRTGRTLTFAQRVRNIAIWWGIPMWLLELVGIPLRLWTLALLIVFPVTALGVLCAAALEHIYFSGKKS
jgi:hypothetical protein